MSQHFRMKQIQLIIYIEFLNLGDSLPQIMYLFVPITYENQKNKKKGSLLKIGVWLLMLLVMHTQTTLNQGLLHTIDLGSEDKRRMRKNPCMQLYIRFKMERIRTKDLTLLIVIELSIFYVGLKSMYLISKSKTNSSYQISEYQ